MTVRPLKWYVGKLLRREYFSLARYGDGELYCMWGRTGSNCDGSDYTPDLQKALLASLRHHADPTFVYGLQHVLPEDKERAEKGWPDVRWYDSEVLGDALVTGTLYPFIDQLRNMKTVVIGNSTHRPIMEILEAEKFIEIPPKNAFNVYTRVIDACWKYSKRHPDTVFLFSAGMAANVFVADLHRMLPNRAWLLDVGHIWDVFVGNPPRSNTENLTAEDINRNLKPSS